jgi:hypothetical protein
MLRKEALGMWIALLAALPGTLTAGTITMPYGMYVMQAVHNQNVPDKTLSDSRLAGFHLRDSWNLFEPKLGVFDYTFYDSQLARAARLNKFVTLGLYAGEQSHPKWGNSPDAFVQAVAALGKRYANNPWLTAVHFSAPQVTDGSMEMYEPASWHGTDQQAIAIWERSISAYAAAFPNVALVLDLAMAPNAKGAVTKAVDEWARQVLGPRFEAIICNLKADTSLTAKHVQELERLHAEGVRVGGEMVSPSSDTSRFGGSFRTALSLGNSLGCQWYQIYQSDVQYLPRLVVAGGVPEPETGLWLIALAAAMLTRKRRHAKCLSSTSESY